MPDFSVFPRPVELKSTLAELEPHSRRALVVFQFSNHSAAFALEEVERITPMAELDRPPGLPLALEGVLNLAGTATPVLRLDRLFALSPQRVGLYSMLIVLRTPSESRLAVLVDRVNQVAPILENTLLPIDRADSLNGCAEATLALSGERIQVLAPSRLLLAKESASLAYFQAMAQRRLHDWEASHT